MISGFSPYTEKKPSLTTYFVCTCDAAIVERVLLVLRGTFYRNIFNQYENLLEGIFIINRKKVHCTFFFLEHYPCSSHSSFHPGSSWTCPPQPSLLPWQWPIPCSTAAAFLTLHHCQQGLTSSGPCSLHPALPLFPPPADKLLPFVFLTKFCTSGSLNLPKDLISQHSDCHSMSHVPVSFLPSQPHCFA